MSDPGAAAPVTVLVVEDEPAMQQRLCEAVSADSAFSLAGRAGTVAEASALVDRIAPDVVLVDLGLPDGDGISVILRARAGDPPSEAIVVSIYGDASHVLPSIRAGANGYLLKDASAAEIRGAILQVRAGGSPISPSIARQVLETLHQPAEKAALEDDSGTLSMRETEILRLVGKGLSFKEVSATLAISPHTVTAHLKRVYRKLQVHSRGEAVYEANQIALL